MHRGKRKNIIVAILLVICSVLSNGCESKAPDEDIVKEFEEEVDNFLENNELASEGSSKQSLDTITVNNVYSDFAAKIKVPDGFSTVGEESNVTNNLYLSSDDINDAVSLSYNFYEYDLLEEIQKDAGIDEEEGGYKDLDITDIKKKQINGYDVRYLQWSYAVDENLKTAESVASVQVNEFQYFSVKIEHMDGKISESEDEFINEIFNGVELFRTGEEPLATYYWNEELKPDEKGMYHIKDIFNSNIKASIGVPKGYKYENSDAGSVTFTYYDEENNRRYQVRYNLSEQEGTNSIEDTLKLSDEMSKDYSDIREGSVQNALIAGWEVQYARIDYKDDSSNYVEYCARTEIQDDYLQVDFEYWGDKVEINDSVLDELFKVVKAE
ncbi:hypothetical protein C818_01965 [Lachnospiraceae bacterium MD308]|nr:hypothetical protein C818_01965 [Lachnospiraceae bacterium MD308]